MVDLVHVNPMSLIKLIRTNGTLQEISIDFDIDQVDEDIVIRILLWFAKLNHR